MPISDQEGYDKGHFTRVYNHIIKPACENAGFEAIRADDEVKTNYIALDIVKKIIESDLVICDLSSKNPNVLYELGIRQAFNKKVVLIKDRKTPRIFDIQGFRTINYDENLRIDEVQKNVKEISNTIRETFESSDGEINSFLQLLSIKPAHLNEQIEISQESSLIMELLGNISERLNKMEESKIQKNYSKSIVTKPEYVYLNKIPFKVGEKIYSEKFSFIGEVVDFDNEFITLKNKNIVQRYQLNDPIFNDILPF